MIGVKSQFTDRHGKPIYSGQTLSKPGEFGFKFYWNKDIGFRFRGQIPIQIALHNYQITEDISWFSKIIPKWI